jgi:hypothetical protein
MIKLGFQILMNVVSIDLIQHSVDLSDNGLGKVTILLILPFVLSKRQWFAFGSGTVPGLASQGLRLLSGWLTLIGLSLVLVVKCVRLCINLARDGDLTVPRAKVDIGLHKADL